MNMKDMSRDELHGKIQEEISDALYSLEEAKDLSETDNPDWNKLYELLSDAENETDDAMMRIREIQNRDSDARASLKDNETG